MAVRETEKYLPAGGAKGLGQCTEKGNYALVSYLTSPIPKGPAIDYVVFATNGAPASGYTWTFKEIPSGTEPPKVVADALAQCKPEHIGTLAVQVEIAGSGSPPVILTLNQEIVEPTGHLFTWFESILAATFGDSDVSLEVLLAFKSYILEAVLDPSVKLPAAFLAAVVYAEANRVGPEERKDALNTAQGPLNSAAPTTADGLYGQALGVGQLLAERLAMVAPRPVSPPTPPSTYTPWEELPAEESAREAKAKAIRAAYLTLPPKDKIELYNLLRFPKANIRMCAALLGKLKSRPHRWDSLSADQLLDASNEIALRILATEYKTGGSLAPKPATPPTPGGPSPAPIPNEAKPTSYGKRTAGLVGKPYIFAHFGGQAEVGGVVSQQTTGQPIPSVRVELRRTVAKIKQAGGLNCYADATSTSTLIAKLPQGVEFGVVEIRWDYPTVNFIWLKVDTPCGDAWINARSNATWYASIYDTLVPGLSINPTDVAGRFSGRVTRRHMYRVHTVAEGFFDGDSDPFIPPRSDLSIAMEPVADAIPELAITDLLHHFVNFDYVTPGHSVQYPYKLEDITGGSIPLEVVEDSSAVRYNDCTTFTEGLLVKAWKDVREAQFVWSWAKHHQWMITGDKPEDRYSPITAAEDSGMVLPGITIERPNTGIGPSSNADAVPWPWTFVQGFENPPVGIKDQWGVGHSYLIVDRFPHPGPDRDQDKVLILESNTPKANVKINGPGFRLIGDLVPATNFSPTREWWNADDVPTWGSVKTRHKYLRMARLKVYDLRWVR